MKVVHVNSDDLAGGAARAAHRLHEGMQALGLESHMVVQRRRSNSPQVHGSDGQFLNRVRRRARQSLDRLPLRVRHGAVHTAWSTGWVPNPSLRRAIVRLAPDLVILHWGGGGFLPNALLSQLPFPIFWVLHDMAPFTGGCHYDRGCGRFRTGCGCCPLLKSQDPADISARTLASKQQHMRVAPHAVIAPSQWIARQARESLLFHGHRIHTIHHPHDLARFRPVPQDQARKALGWPQDRAVLLFGAVHGGDDPRKGFDLLAKALSHPLLADDAAACELRVFGAAKGPSLSTAHPIQYEGVVDDDARMALLYSAADLVVAPSRQEAFGLTGSEAICCGTPVVAFAETGLADIVEHRHTGYLAQPGDADDLASGIHWILSDKDRRQSLRRQARARAEMLFGLQDQAQAYLRLYESVSRSTRHQPEPASSALLQPVPTSMGQ